MKLVGIDYGMKRVGVAVSDESGTMAFPKAIFPNNKMLMEEITRFITAENAEAVVVGESRNRTGEDNPIMGNIRTFVSELEQSLGLPVHLEPEFYTSAEAKRLSLDTKAPKQSQQHVDAKAAAIILNSFIART